jgi:peptidoglycan biosynthesis protein MviN/MurJ (putative lipid II flippase)
MFIAFPWLAPHMVKFEGETLRLYVTFGRLALLTNFLFVFGNTLGQYLISIQRYWMYGITPIVWSLGTILGTYFLTPALGSIGPIVGTVIGTCLYVAFRLYAVFRAGFHLSFDRDSILHPELVHMGLLILPRMTALGALQLQLLLLDKLASGLGKQMVAINQFASNFESVIPGIVGIAIAQSAFSLFSQAAALKDSARLKDAIRKGIFFNLSLAIPGGIALAALTPVAAWIMRLHGPTSVMFSQSLLLYALAVPFESTNHIILRSFYALKNTSVPALSSAVSCAFAIVIGTWLVGSIGVYALAVAYVTAQLSQTVLLGTALARYVRRYA